MYVNNGGPIASASSPDGLTFTQDDGLRLDEGSVPGSIVLPDGTVRMYVCNKGISLYESQDGLNFHRVQEGVIPAEAGQIICDPSPTTISGGYLLIYKTRYP